jgi:hypothetical protein
MKTTLEYFSLPASGIAFGYPGAQLFKRNWSAHSRRIFHQLHGTRDGQSSRIFRSKCSERRVCSFSFLPQLCYVLWLQHSQWRTPQPQMRASSVSAPTAVTLRVFRANDKMSAKEPVSVTRGQAGSHSQHYANSDTALASFLVLGTVWRL